MSELTFYVGPYFDLPNNIPSNDLEAYLVGQDTLSLCFVENRTGNEDFLSDKITSFRDWSYSMSYSDEDINVYNINEDFIKKAKIAFANKTVKLRDSIQKKYGVNPEIKFGILRCDE